MSGTGAEAPMEGLAALDYAVLQQCIHCGMCLPTCPTYEETRVERHSPRGRIALMRAVADGDLEVGPELAAEMSYCLGCLACESACPAGVDYRTMFETARAEIEEKRVAGGGLRSFWRWLTIETLFMNPRLLRAFGRILRFYQVSGAETFVRRWGMTALLPGRLRELEKQTPRMARRFSQQLIKAVELPSDGPIRYRVAVLTGCVQDLVFAEINRDTVEVLRANGCEVHTPPVQPCCGSLHAHNGEPGLARELAQRLIDLIPPDQYDAIITNSGGCGGHLRHFGALLDGNSQYRAAAKTWDRKIRDIHQWLAEIGARPATSKPKPETVAYHHSCHLYHGQKVKAEPFDVLRLVPGVTLVPLAEADWCCGSAGIYNITQPAQSAKLLDRKIGHLRETSATILATANPGCHLQIERGLAEAGLAITVRHPVSLLAEAYRSEAKRKDG